MKRLYLHIGCHKTGSTTIQRFFKRNTDQLAMQGYLYPKTNRGSRHQMVARMLDPGASRENARSVEVLREEIDRSGAEKVVISSEGLAWVETTEQIGKLRHFLEGLFDEFKIIYLIRRQDLLTVSHHQKGVKGGRKALKYYGAGEHLFVKGIARAWDYQDHYQRYQHWANIFGEENITLQIFEPEHYIGGDLRRQFCHLLGVNWLSSMQYLDDSNRSISDVSQMMLEGLERNWEKTDFRDENGVRGDIIRLLNQFERGQKHKRGKLLPGREAALAYYARYEESNEALRRERFPHQEMLFNNDFSMYPEQDRRETLTPRDMRKVVQFVLRHADLGVSEEV